MKSQDLYISQGKMLESLRMRKSIKDLVETSGPHELVSLGSILLDKSWNADQIDRDLGSSAIECLINEIEYADHNKIQSVYERLVEEDVI